MAVLSLTMKQTCVILSIKNFNGVRLTMGYTVTDKESGATVLTGETKHCFTNTMLKPIRLQKNAPDYYDKFMEMKV